MRYFIFKMKIIELVKKNYQYNDDGKSFQIYISSFDDFYMKIAYINYSIIHKQNVIILYTDDRVYPYIQNIYPFLKMHKCEEGRNPPSLKRGSEMGGHGLLENDDYEFECIYYIASGLTGDFINELSIINEYYINTGRKGILYLSELREKFRHSLKNMYHFTKDLVMTCTYIQEYHIYTNEKYDIDLTKWRDYHHILYKIFNWNIIFNSVYSDIDWGSHQWIFGQYDKKWKDKILVHCTRYRPIEEFEKIYNKYDTKLCFVTTSENDVEFFEYFLYKYIDYNIQIYKMNSFIELVNAISSCEMFIGTMSMPFTIAHACHKKRVILNNKDPYISANYVHNIGYDNVYEINTLP